MVFFVRGTLESTPQTYGVIDASWMVGMLIGAWVGGLTVRPATTDQALARRLVLAVAVICVAIVAVGSMADPWWVVPCYLVGGSANGALSVYAATLLGRRVPQVARGRAGTAANMRMQGCSLLGFVAGGLLLGTWGPRWILLGCGVLGLLTTAVVFGVVNRAVSGGGPVLAEEPRESAATA
jgi:MFS family permease